MRVVFRTEGNHRVGMGDVWRSIALADEFSGQSDEVRFILSGGEEEVATVGDSGHRYDTVDSLAAEHGVLEAFQPAVIIVNKLNNAPEYIKSLRQFPGLVVTLDDAGEGAQYSELRINVIFPIPGSITDPKYVPLRNEFPEIHGKLKVISEDPHELLITQGGSDTYGFTHMIVRALGQMAWRPHCTVVVGPAFRHQVELEQAVADSSLNLTVIQNARNMSEVMWNADLAITAGGITMYELACTGTPSLVIGAERWDLDTAAWLELEEAVIFLGFGGDIDYRIVPEAVNSLAVDVDKRQQMSDRCKRLVDGRGSIRTVELIREHAGRGRVNHQ